MNRARTNIHWPAHAANRDFFKIASDGIKLSIKNEDTHKDETVTLRVFDWSKPSENEFLAVAQVTMQGPLYKCIPDITLFVNGLPWAWVVIELKRPGVPAKQGFDENLTSYKHPQNGVPQLFAYNAFLIASNGNEAKVGSLTADWGRFLIGNGLRPKANLAACPWKGCCAGRASIRACWIWCGTFPFFRAYTPDVYKAKTGVVFQHVIERYALAA